MTTVYWPQVDDPRAGNRYAGHHAEILREQGTLAQVAVYPPGKSQAPGAHPATMWIDLASSDQCDAGPGSLTVIGTGNAPKHGALFLISGGGGHVLEDQGRGVAAAPGCEGVDDVGGCGHAAMVSGHSMRIPRSKREPARTRATRCGAFTARQRAWAASMSLNARTNVLSSSRRRAQGLVGCLCTDAW
jgi:hypothetical protein